MSKYTDALPSPERASINTGIAPCPTAYLEREFGLPRPRSSIKPTCQPPTVAKWKRVMETKDVGPFSATGHYKFLEVLERAFRVLKRDNPDLYDRLGSAGCLCIRWVRGSKSVVSNHSFGLAIDLTIDGLLDTRGDNATQRGLFEVYKVFKGHGLFWGAEFKTEDSMHFEASAALVQSWIKNGTFWR